MSQKFKSYSFIHVIKDLPRYMAHFKSDFDGIVRGSYRQLHGNGNTDSYSIYVLENGKIVDTISWYGEYQLVLLPDQDRLKALEIVDKYLE